jgi:hypothetical protein
MATTVLNRGAAIMGDAVVSSAGTAVQLETDKTLGWHSVAIVAKLSNTGKIYVGGSDVDSNTSEGLAAGASWNMKDEGKVHGIFLDDFYIDASVDGEGVDFSAMM